MDEGVRASKRMWLFIDQRFIALGILLFNVFNDVFVLTYLSKSRFTVVP